MRSIWRKDRDGLKTDHARKLEDLERENARLNRTNRWPLSLPVVARVLGPEAAAVDAAAPADDPP